MFMEIENKIVYKINNYIYVDSEGIKQVRNNKAYNPVSKTFSTENFKSLVIEEIDNCKRYILFSKESNTYINNSYSLKHQVEKHFKSYVSNGAFIVALLYFKKKIRFYENTSFFEKKDLYLGSLKKDLIQNLSYNVYCKLKSY